VILFQVRENKKQISKEFRVRINMSSDDELELNRVLREAMLVIQRAQQLISEGFDPEEAVRTACREAKGD
jgi:hypothetical protein